MIAFSFLNLAEAASIAASTTFTEQDTTVGLRFPRHPHLRGYSPDLATHNVTLDFGSATALDVIALIHGNLTLAQISGNATDAWGGPSYFSGNLTPARSTNDRYHHAHRPSVAAPFTYRFARLYAVTGATTDGATQWALGGLWAGTLVLPPTDIYFEFDEEKLEARADERTEDGRMVGRVALDDAAYQLTATRRAYSIAQLMAWREIDRQWAEAPGQAALVCLHASYPAEAYVMRQMMVSKWHQAGAYMQSDMLLTEVTAG